MDLECSMDSKGKFNQLSFTMLKQVWEIPPVFMYDLRTLQLQKIWHREIKSLPLLCKNEQSGYFRKEDKAGKFNRIFSSGYELCHEFCRGCLFITVFITHPWNFHICFHFEIKKYFHSLFLTWWLRIWFS